MIISKQQQLFDIPPGISYLNCASLSPLMKTVEAAGIAAIQQRREPWAIPASQWFEPAEALRSEFAHLIATTKEQIALVPSVSYGIAVAMNNITLSSTQSIVLIDQEFPSNFYAWRELSTRTGAAIVTVKRTRDETWTEAVLKSIDERTGLVTISGCHWTDGSFIDLVQIGKKARAVGAKFVVDASQSLGAYPLSIEELKPDFLVTVGYKWLMGPYNLAYLYAAPEWTAQGKPIEFSWMTKAGADDFARLGSTDEMRAGARRFDAGEFSSFIHIPMAIAGLRQIRQWGVENIQETLGVLTDHADARAQELGYQPAARPDRVGHIIGIPMQQDVEGLKQKLTDEKIYISFRGSNMRIAPHLYNDKEDIDRLFGVFSLPGK